MNFGTILKHLRQIHFLSQEELANKLNISRSNIANYETSKNLPSVEILQKISTLFGVSTDYLLGNTDIDNPKQILEEKLAALHLSEKELEEATKHVLDYYSSNQIINSISKENFSNSKIEKAFCIIQSIAANFFGNKIDKTLGESFDFCLPHSADEHNKMLEIQNYTKQKVNELINSLNKDKIIISQNIQEEIQKQYGNYSIHLLDDYSKLNELGKQTANIYIKDLTEIPKYTKKKSSQDSQNED